MHGLNYLRVKGGLFREGFLQTYLGLSEEAIAYMESGLDSYLLAKLAAVEVWGSLFYLDQAHSRITERLLSTTQFEID